MRVLWIHPPLRVHTQHIDYPAFASLAVWQNAAHLAACGHSVDVLDAFALPTADRRDDPPYFVLGATLDEMESRIAEARFEVAILHLGAFSVQNPDPALLWRLVAACRAGCPDAPVIFADAHIGGMNYVAYDPGRYLTHPNRPDWLVRYEGEVALASLLDTLEKHPSDSPLRAQPIDGRPLKGPLSAYGGEVYRQVDLRAYRAFLARALAADTRPNPFAATPGTLPFKASRGCCFACRFCTSNPAAAAGIPREWRPLDGPDLEAQLAAFAALEGVDKLWVLDEAANVGREHFDRLLDGAIRHGLKLEFPNGLRADKLSREQVAKLAGLISRLSLSPESGSPGVLDRLIHKHQSLERVEEVARWAQEDGLPVGLHFMVGFPGESAEDIRSTFFVARDLYVRTGAEPWVQFVVALPGTAVFETCRKNGWLPDSLPIDYNPLFQDTPMLKDGACGLSNTELINLKRALMRDLGF